MQKALTQMNSQLHRVLSDITGYTGLNILRAIIAEERDTLKAGANEASAGQEQHRRHGQGPGQSAMQSKSAVGAFIRRINARLGAPTAINAGAHKLARLLFGMLKFGEAYVEAGQDYYETKYKDRLLRNLQKRAANLGFQLTPTTFGNAVVS